MLLNKAMKRTITSALSLLFAALLFTACGGSQKDESTTPVQEETQEAAEETGEAADKAAEETGDKVEEAGDKAEDATDD
jgi:outer membrane PBP1 activator LpoA protein